MNICDVWGGVGSDLPVGFELPEICNQVAESCVSRGSEICAAKKESNLKIL